MMYLKAFGIWLILAIVAIINGSIRNFTYQKLLPELLSHQISTITGVIFSGLVMYFWIINNSFSDKELLLVGLFWFVLTIIFEFVFGYFVAGHTLSKLLEDYNLLKGRVWSLFLIFTLFGPYIINKIFK